MRTNPLVLGLLALLPLAGATSCGGAGRPGAADVFQRLNAAGVRCQPQDVELALPTGKPIERSCLTSDGKEIGLRLVSSQDEQQKQIDRLEQDLARSVFPVVVYDFGYLMYVPDRQLGERVTQVMDARSLSVASAVTCPMPARGGVCPRS